MLIHWGERGHVAGDQRCGRPQDVAHGDLKALNKPGDLLLKGVCKGHRVPRALLAHHQVVCHSLGIAVVGHHPVRHRVRVGQGDQGAAGDRYLVVLLVHQAQRRRLFPGDDPHSVGVHLARQQHPHAAAEDGVVGSALQDSTARDGQVVHRLIKFYQRPGHRRAPGGEDALHRGVPLKEGLLLILGVGGIGVLRHRYPGRRRAEIHPAAQEHPVVRDVYRGAVVQPGKVQLPLLILLRADAEGKEELVQVLPPGGDGQPAVYLHGLQRGIQGVGDHPAHDVRQHRFHGLAGVKPAVVQALVQQPHGGETGYLVQAHPNPLNGFHVKQAHQLAVVVVPHLLAVDVGRGVRRPDAHPGQHGKQRVVAAQHGRGVRRGEDGWDVRRDVQLCAHGVDGQLRAGDRAGQDAAAAAYLRKVAVGVYGPAGLDPVAAHPATPGFAGTRWGRSGSKVTVIPAQRRTPACLPLLTREAL